MAKVKLDKVAVNAIGTAMLYTKMYKAVAYISNIVKEKIRKKGSGRIYRRGKTTHQASAAGEPPSTDTGRLLGSINYTVGADGRDIVGRVSANTEYAKYLEYGTTKMKPRPFLRPSLEEARRIIVGIFK